MIVDSFFLLLDVTRVASASTGIVRWLRIARLPVMISARRGHVHEVRNALLYTPSRPSASMNQHLEVVKGRTVRFDM